MAFQGNTSTSGSHLHSDGIRAGFYYTTSKLAVEIVYTRRRTAAVGGGILRKHEAHRYSSIIHEDIRGHRGGASRTLQSAQRGPHVHLRHDVAEVVIEMMTEMVSSLKPYQRRRHHRRRRRRYSEISSHVDSPHHAGRRASFILRRATASSISRLISMRLISMRLIPMRLVSSKRVVSRSLSSSMRPAASATITSPVWSIANASVKISGSGAIGPPGG